MSTNGKLNITIMNLDSFESGFYLSVMNCTPGVLDIPA